MHEFSTRVRLIGSDESLSSSASALFKHAAGSGFFHSSVWLENLRRHGAPPGDWLRLYAIEAGDGSLQALIPAVYSRLYDVHPRARVLHFLQPDGLNYAPLLAPGDQDELRAIKHVLQSLFPDRRAYDVIRFSPLGRGSSFADGLIALLRRHRHPLQIYRIPDDWYAPVAGSFAGYMANRPAALCKTLDQVVRWQRDAGSVKFRLVQRPREVEAGWRDYQRVFELSGNELGAESMNYLSGIIQAAAACGALRLGLLDLDGAPVAAQLWIASAGVARCLRILCNARERDLPLDDMLTHDLVARLIDVDGVAELAFGALDVQYAANWATARRERIGLAAFNPRTWRGMKGAARHVGAQFIKSLFGQR